MFIKEAGGEGGPLFLLVAESFSTLTAAGSYHGTATLRSGTGKKPTFTAATDFRRIISRTHRLYRYEKK